MKTDLLKLYFECRERKPFMLVGRDAECSLDTARTILAFRQAEADGLVRLRAEPEQENYFSVFGDHGPFERNGHEISVEQWRKETTETLDRDGVWWTCAEWFDGEEWQMADSCGMHAGYKDPLDPFENCYVVDEMRSALDALAKHQEEVKDLLSAVEFSA